MPNQGFFSRHELVQVKRPPSLVPRCGQCKLDKKCSNPKIPVYGEGRKGILVVGECPGCITEDQQGRPFVGNSGQLLASVLAEHGVDMDRDCWRTNAVICWPWEQGADGKKNRTPTYKEIDWCRPNLNRTLKELQPRIIIPLGGLAVRSLIGPLFAENPGPIGRWVGWRIPCQALNAWVCPNWHPSYILRSEHDRVLRLLFGEHLRDAVVCKGRPWPGGAPDWKSTVERIIDTEQAAEEIDTFYEEDVPVAWDIETNMLKPDSDRAEIVCCSLSDGERTIAYPWHGKARTATLDLLQSKVPKVGYNVKFETRWLLAKEKVRVRNWIWDGMLAAHTLDNRGDICSLDFQAFVQLGFGDWHSHVGGFLKSRKPGCNEPNRVREIDLDTLLLYGGLDALLEWKLWEKQSKRVEEMERA